MAKNNHVYHSSVPQSQFFVIAPYTTFSHLMPQTYCYLGSHDLHQVWYQLFLYGVLLTKRQLILFLHSQKLWNRDRVSSINTLILK